MPGGAGERSSGSRHLAPALMRAALAVGVEGLFLETHSNPAAALSDGPNVVPSQDLPAFFAESRPSIALSAGLSLHNPE